MIQSTNANYKFIIALQRIAMGMPVAVAKGCGVGVARGSKRSWNYVEETDTEEEVDIGTSDESEIVFFFLNDKLYKTKYEFFIYAGGKVCLILFQQLFYRGRHVKGTVWEDHAVISHQKMITHMTGGNTGWM